MAVEIIVNNSQISDNARVVNSAYIKHGDDVRISVDNTQLDKWSAIVDTLDVDAFVREVQRQKVTMDKTLPEYEGVQEILNTSRYDKEELPAKIGHHLASFSQGVLASILANMIS
jgi:hypothetical protein